MSHIETRLEMQGRLDAQKTAAERNVLGQFATPPGLARDIVAATLSYLPDGSPIRFLEPALGTGSFFESLIRQADGRVEEALGVEVDPSFAQASRTLWSGSRLRVINDDFTSLKPSELAFRCNLLITNPPYVRHHHIEGDCKARLVAMSQRAAGIRLSGLAGLYVHFILLAHSWLEPGAVSAWLIPSEFMDVNYGEGLKRYLTERVDLLRIHRFCPGDVQFDDALVTSTVVVFRNQPPQQSRSVIYTHGGSMADPRKVKEVAIAELAGTRKWSSLPAPSDRSVSGPYVALGDAFTIRRGLATGDNGFFIRQLAEFDRLNIPHEFLKPVLPPPRNVRELDVNSDSDGYPLLTPKLALFDCPLSEQTLKQDFPAAWSFVQAGAMMGVDKGYLASSRSPWYSQERRDPPPLLCTYMGRHKSGQAPFRIIRNRSMAVATNVYLLLYPKPWILRADDDGFLLDRICEELRLLGPSAFTSEGRVYGGGLHKMEPKELARLPLQMEGLANPNRQLIQGVLFEKRKPYAVRPVRRRGAGEVPSASEQAFDNPQTTETAKSPQPPFA